MDKSRQETAVEWLLNEFTNGNYGVEVGEQAKEIEKQQIMNAYDCAFFGHGINGKPCASGGKYYTETFGTRLQNETNSK